jgi:3-hydroxyisobutyrate dehydrogenase
MVPEGSHVRSVYLTPDTGVLATDCSNKLLIDCSTIDTTTVLQVGEEVQKAYPSASFYDAPVSGGVLGATKGTLTFMMGCKEDDARIDDLRYFLGMMGKSIVPCGGLSLGVTAKLCHNFCSALIAIATSEAMNIGMKAGMDPRVIKNVFSSSVAQSTILDKWCPCPGIVPDCPASNGYKPGFRIELMRKDFNLAVDTANRVGAKLAIGNAGLQCYTDAMNDPNCKGLDSRVVYRFIGGDENWDGKQAEREAWRNEQS